MKCKLLVAGIGSVVLRRRWCHRLLAENPQPGSVEFGDRRHLRLVLSRGRDYRPDRRRRADPGPVRFAARRRGFNRLRRCRRDRVLPT